MRVHFPLTLPRPAAKVTSRLGTERSWSVASRWAPSGATSVSSHLTKGGAAPIRSCTAERDARDLLNMRSARMAFGTPSHPSDNACGTAAQPQRRFFPTARSDQNDPDSPEPKRKGNNIGAQLPNWCSGCSHTEGVELGRGGGTSGGVGGTGGGGSDCSPSCDCAHPCS